MPRAYSRRVAFAAGRIMTLLRSPRQEPADSAPDQPKSKPATRPGVFGEPWDASWPRFATSGVKAQAHHSQVVCKVYKRGYSPVDYRWCFRVIAGKALYRHRTIR